MAKDEFIESIRRMESERIAKEAEETPEPAVEPEAPKEAPEGIEAPVVEQSPEAVIADLLPDKKEIEIQYKDREFLNEESKLIYDKLANGEYDEVRDLLNEVTKDFKKMNDLDRIRETMKRAFPNLDAEDIEDDIREKFHLYDEDDDEYDPKKAKKGLRELKKESVEALAKLEAAKKKIELPKIERGATQVAQNADLNNEEVSRIRNENTRKWLESIETGVNSLPDFKFKLDNEEVAFKIEESDKKALSEELKDFNLANFAEKRGWFKVNANDPNSIDQFPAIVAKDKFILDNYEKMIKSAYHKGKSEGRIKEVTTLKNLDLGITPQQIDAGKTSDEVSFFRALLSNKSTKL